MSTLNNKVFTKPKHYNFWDVSVFADNMIYIHRQSKYADINESLLTLTVTGSFKPSGLFPPALQK